MGKGSKTAKLKKAAAANGGVPVGEPVKPVVLTPVSLEAVGTDYASYIQRCNSILGIVDQAHEARLETAKRVAPLPPQRTAEVNAAVKEICDPTNAATVRAAMNLLKDVENATTEPSKFKAAVVRAVHKYADDPEGPTVRAVNCVMYDAAELAQKNGKLETFARFIKGVMGEERGSGWVAAFKGGVRYETNSCGWCGALQLGDVQPFHVCQGCMRMHYCSEGCQLVDWRMGGHCNKCKASVFKGANYMPPSERHKAVKPTAREQELLEKLQNKILEQGLPKREDAMEVVQNMIKEMELTDPELMMEMAQKEAVKMEYDRKEGSRPADVRTIRVLVERVTDALEEKERDANEIPGVNPEKDIPALQCYCVHDEHFRACWEEGAVSVLRRVVDSEKANMYGQIVAAWGVCEPAMLPENRPAMVEQGYVEWAIEKMKLSDRFAELVAALEAGSTLLPGPAAVKKVKTAIADELGVPFQAARLLAELAQDPEGHRRAVEGGAVENMLPLITACTRFKVHSIYIMQLHGQTHPKDETKHRVWTLMRALGIVSGLVQGTARVEGAKRLSDAGGEKVLAAVAQWDRMNPGIEPLGAELGRDMLQGMLTMCQAIRRG